MLETYQLVDNKVHPVDSNTADILLYIDPSDDEKKFLTHELAIDPFTLNSCLDPDEISRIEFEDDYTVLIVKRPKSYSADDRFVFKINSFGIFMFPQRIVIIAAEYFSFIKDKRFMRVASTREFVIKLIYLAVLHFNEHLKIINMISSELESKINTSMENRYLLDMFGLSKSLVYYLNALNANALLLQKISNYTHRLQFTETEREMLDDLIIENSQCYKVTEIYSNILSSMMDARVSIVNNNLNMLMKTLNVMTITIMVPTFVVSAFSMNVVIPLRDYPYAFWVIMAIAITSAVLFLSIWQLKK